MIGSRLGPYELLQELGRGGMATVYRAYQPSMDRQVAVKVIHQVLTGESATVERFQREARLIARLEHPHILPVYDFDGTHTPQYIVMRYVAGGTLKEVLERGAGTLTTAHAVRVLQQVAAALDYAHRQGIVHRDLKPSNVMVDSEGNTFLTDYGIARLVGGDDEAITREGAVVGTPAYMAPEQATAASGAGPSADLYGFAVMAFEMLTGSLPFSTDEPVTTLLMHLSEPPPRPTERAPGLPAAVDAVLLRALSKEPRDRYQTAGEMTEALALALGVTATSPAAGPPLPPPTPREPSRRDARTVDSQATISERKKVVTALCANTVELAELMDESPGGADADQAGADLLARLRAVVGTFGGMVVRDGDTGLLALWGAEATREDDAERAVRAALAARDLLATVGQRGSEDELMPVRIGVHTGLALLAPAQPVSDTGVAYTASGATVSIATRLAEAAHGEVRITHDTFREVRGVFDLAPADPIRVRARRGSHQSPELATYRVLAAKARVFRVSARGVEGVETALVGRRAELELLQKALLTAVEDRETQVVTLVGGAGLGKSRLLDEFDKWADLRPERLYLFRGRATPASTHTPFALLRDLLSFRFEVLDNDPPATVRDRIERGMARLLRQPEPDTETAHLVGHLAGFDLGGSRHVEGLSRDPRQLAARARQLFVRFFVQLAGVQPVMVTLEDVHNADDPSLDLLAELVDEQQALPLLVVYLARPGLFERRPDWGGGQPFHRRVMLEPLDRRDSRDLVAEVLKKVTEVPRALRDLLVERAEGNPLFMEELVKMLIEDRVVIKDSEITWHVEPTRIDRLRVPPTLAGLLQARLDTLLYPERLALQRAAVIGRVFHDTALAALDAADEAPAHLTDLAATLTRLVERGFLHRRETSSFEGSVEYAFAQNMMRGMIYESLLRRQRDAYHAAAATWLAASERADELLPQIAQHRERAGQTDQAISVLTRAGDRARQVCAFAEAHSFWLRALDLLSGLEASAASPERGERSPPPPEPPSSREVDLRVRLGEVLRLQGDYGGAQGHLEVALSLAREARDPQDTAAALFQLSQVASVQGDYPRAQELVDESLPLARAAADPGTLAQVLYSQGDLLWRSGRYDDAVAPLEESLTHARAADDPTTELYALNRLGTVSMFQKRLEEASARFVEGRELAARTGNRDRLATFLNNLGEVARLEGSTASARDLYLETLEIIREVGQRDVEAVVLSNLGAISLDLGEMEEAEGHARAALRLALEIELTRMTVGTLILFAQLRARRGDSGGALALLGLVLAHPAADADLREYAAPTLDELRVALGHAALEAGLERGRELPFRATVEELLSTA